MQLWLLFESFPAGFPPAIRLFHSGISKGASLSRYFLNKLNANFPVLLNPKV